MNKVHNPLRTLVSAAVVGIMATSTAYSGGFSLYTEDSPSAIGNYAAGIAAEAADASTGWYNPAGLVFIHNQQVVAGGVGVFPTAKLSGTSTFHTPGLNNYVQNFQDLNGGESAFVPSFHYALPVGENVTFGFSSVSPFGLATDWGNQSAVRYQATLSELITVNVSPEFGARLTEHFSYGAGLDVQYARVKFNTILGAPNLYAPVLPATLIDTLTYNNGNSMGVGFHTGVMAMFNDNHTRIGLNYQSKMRHSFHGQSRLVGRLATPGLIIGLPASVANSSSSAVFKNNQLYANPIELPDVVTLSGYQDVNESLAFLGSVVYTGWSSFKQITLNNVAAPAINPFTTQVTQVQAISSKQQNYLDAWRFALGANYRVNQQWMLRVGGGYDATPTNDAFRDVRLPDVNRWALSIGTHYQARPAIGVDVGYTHIFTADDSIVNRTDTIGTSSTFNVNAVSKAHVDLVGAQVVWVIDKPMEAPTK